MLSGMRAGEVIAAFAAAWNTAHDARRLDLLAACRLPDAVFAAPRGRITGIGVPADREATCRWQRRMADGYQR
jgi:hypothetical protein